MPPEHMSTPRLDEWLRRTQTPLDLLALLTIWLTILPFTTATDTTGLTGWVVGRLVLSVVYGIDVAVRCHLSEQPFRYFRTHPLAVAAVVIPFIRIFFSLRLLSSMFRKGALGHFLFVAAMLILNGVVLVYFFEVNAPGSNIATVGDSLWWAAVTVATVGYGDFYPVTVGGRITAVGLMGVGLVTAAVITAQIASTFMDQSAARRAALAASKETGASGRLAWPTDTNASATPPTGSMATTPSTGPPVAVPAEAGLDQAPIHERLDRIEALLRDRFEEGT
jgi:voltage-gated potassium channel